MVILSNVIYNSFSVLYNLFLVFNSIYFVLFIRIAYFDRLKSFADIIILVYLFKDIFDFIMILFIFQSPINNDLPTLIKKKIKFYQEVFSDWIKEPNLV